jgi:hypothetical protein
MRDRDRSARRTGSGDPLPSIFMISAIGYRGFNAKSRNRSACDTEEEIE